MEISRSLRSSFSWITAALVLLSVFATPVSSFYLPGVAPADFQKRDPLSVKVNKLTSIKTHLPYSYYSLPYCKPNEIVDSAENLGEVLSGDHIENSPYVFQMREAQMCQIVCKITLNDKQAKELKEKIEDEYRVNMILDNLPLVVPLKRQDQEGVLYQHGFHVGVKGQYAGSKEEKYFINNHVSFVVKFHKDPETDLARIVSFEVKPFSVKHEFEGEWNGNKTRLTTCDPHSKHLVTNSDTRQEVEANKDIIFTYDVDFESLDRKISSIDRDLHELKVEERELLSQFKSLQQDLQSDSDMDLKDIIAIKDVLDRLDVKAKNMNYKMNNLLRERTSALALVSGERDKLEKLENEARRNTKQHGHCAINVDPIEEESITMSQSIHIYYEAAKESVAYNWSSAFLLLL